jgi:collagenase-like PrtC family protease
MELVLASNFDDQLVERTADLPVSTYFGMFPVSLIGGGRPPQILPPVDTERFRAHLVAVHRHHRTFFATLNSNDLGLHEYEPGYVDRLLRDVGRLLDLGVDGFVVALPAVIEAIRSAWPDVPISASTFARIRTVTQADYFQRLGVRTVVLEEANRDFRLIRGLVRRGLEVEILVNQTCLPSCPYRAHHLNTSSLASQPGAAVPAFEYPILECGLEYVRDPAKLISGVFVRPEDLEVYEEVGVHRFKVSGRNRTTDWLVRAVEAYAQRRYFGNLVDIVSLVQVKGPLQALERINQVAPDPEARTLELAFRQLRDISIDNGAFPEGFLRHIAAVDCEHTSCTACGYCRGVAERVMKVGGRPPSEYRPPALPPAIRMLPRLGPTPECEEPIAP